MMRFLFYFGIGFIIMNVPKGGQGVVIFADRKGSSIECSSNDEITFTFISPVEGESFAIAECLAIIQTCFLLVKGLEHTYNISNTERGGILHINHIGNNAYGTYQCCETYHPSNCVTVDIIPRYIGEGDEHITRYEGTNSIIVTTTAIFIGIILIIISMTILWRMKLKVLANRMTRSLKSDNEEFELDPMFPSDDAASVLQKKDFTMRAFRKVMEHTENALRELSTISDSVSRRDSHKTFANVETTVEDIETQCKRITEKLKTVREAYAGKDATDLKRRSL